MKCAGIQHPHSLHHIIAAFALSNLLYSSTFPLSPEPGEGCGARGTVYIVQTIDTEAFPAPLASYSAILNLNDFKSGGLVDRLTSGLARSTYKDSFDRSPIYTWFLLSDEFFCASTNGDCAAVHTAMEPYLDAAKDLGDGFGWHYHNLDWSDMNHDGVYYWNQLLTFNGTEYGSGTDIGLAEKSLACLIIEKRFFSSLFRSGWGWENNDFSCWLDNVVPFDFSNFSPLHSYSRLPDGIDNVYDWSKAPVGWSYYHPNEDSYQHPGELKRYIFRTSNSLQDMERAFAAADSGRNQMVVTYSHSYDNGEGLDYSLDIEILHCLYPCVPFQFVNALDGVRVILGLADTAQPQITIQQNESRFHVVSDMPLFTFPYGALRTAGGEYLRVFPLDSLPDTGAGGYGWFFDLDDYARDYAPMVFSVAGVTPSGNTFVSDQYGVDCLYVTSADEDPENLPGRLGLSQNSPNPFNGGTEIYFTLPTLSRVRLAVYNILGQMVTTLVDDELPAATHTVFWDGTDTDGQSVASGLYIYRLEAQNFSDSRKMILMK